MSRIGRFFKGVGRKIGKAFNSAKPVINKIANVASKVGNTVGKVASAVSPYLNFIPKIGPIASAVAGGIGGIGSLVGDISGKIAGSTDGKPGGGFLPKLVDDVKSGNIGGAVKDSVETINNVRNQILDYKKQGENIVNDTRMNLRRNNFTNRRMDFRR